MLTTQSQPSSNVSVRLDAHKQFVAMMTFNDLLSKLDSFLQHS